MDDTHLNAINDAGTAYHEAGHAWVYYWHVLRMGWCESIEIMTGEESRGDALGYCAYRGLREPDPMTWGHHAAGSAAGMVAEGIYGEREGVHSWADWATRSRLRFEEELEEIRSFGEPPGRDDFSHWCSLGTDYQLAITVDLYWQGWTDAERLIRAEWSIVESLALACNSKRRLTSSEVLEICASEEA